ncbi:hypothetical protein B566_EDAN012289 [Ephemera danica]|nr:hypothetical protein B566_EDAN012289 [Ephemera danica]
MRFTMGKVLFFVVLFLAVIYGDDDLLSRLKRQVGRVAKQKGQKKVVKSGGTAIKKKSAPVNPCLGTDFKNYKPVRSLRQIPPTNSRSLLDISSSQTAVQEKLDTLLNSAGTGMRCLFNLMNAVNSDGDVDYDKLKAGYEARASAPWNYFIGQIG